MEAMNSKTLSIGKLAKLCGLSSHALRFYEAEGILKPVNRATNGHRQYREEDIRWLEFVLRLKSTGMPLAEIKQYAALRTQGDSTLKNRMAMLQLHRDRLLSKINDLSTSLKVLDDKVSLYKEIIDNPH